jgi:hypothetical protein
VRDQLFGIWVAWSALSGLGWAPPAVAQPEPFVCPDLSVGEIQEDCPWAAVARGLIATANTPPGVLARLRQQLPGLHRQIQADSTSTFMKGLWGQSINFDEGARAITVDPSILDAITSSFAVPAADKNIVHAGAIHTYGYLFSVLKTSFGYKRARWVSGVIERGLGIGPGVLGPEPSEGTLFANVTYLAARVAFRDDAPRLSRLEREAKVSPSIKALSWKDLSITRLEEVALVKEPGEARTQEVALYTDFLLFPKATDSNAALLVYSVREGLGGQKLITAFPVDRAFVDRATAAKDLGEEKKIKARYNAYVKSLEGRTVTGSRSLIKD